MEDEGSPRSKPDPTLQKEVRLMVLVLIGILFISSFLVVASLFIVGVLCVICGVLILHSFLTLLFTDLG